MEKLNLIGKKFGKRLVLGSAPKKWGVKPFWRVRCECGTEDDVVGIALRKGQANQCRKCRAKEFVARSTIHGHARAGRHTPTFKSWASMLTRCNNPKSHEWLNYGGRGIVICERWKDFRNFLMDMGERPKGKTLDRYPDVNGNYEPGNCRWATAKEQIMNRRKHGLIETFTDTELLAELARRGINA